MGGGSLAGFLSCFAKCILASVYFDVGPRLPIERALCAATVAASGGCPAYLLTDTVSRPVSSQEV